MTPLQSTSEIVQFFLENDITQPEVEDKKLEITYGIRLIEKSKSRFDERNQLAEQTSKEWSLGNRELAWGSYVTLGGIVRRWDITTDGSIVCYRKTFVDFVYYSVELLSKEEIDSITETKKKEIEEKEQREKIRDILTPVLIQKMYPFAKLESGELEMKYGVHLHQIKRDEHRFMQYKPGYGNSWVVGKSLNWGSSCGWDITYDGKIACCRIGYDDYVNFEIEILSEKQIEEYKAKYTQADKELVNRLATLQEMYNQSLITAEEFESKKQAVLNLI